MTVKIFANVHQLMFLVLKLVWIRIEYCDVCIIDISVISLGFAVL